MLLKAHKLLTYRNNYKYKSLGKNHHYLLGANFWLNRWREVRNLLRCSWSAGALVDGSQQTEYTF